MNKKQYMKPEMRVVKLRQKHQILQVSNYGVQKSLQTEEIVEEAW